MEPLPWKWALFVWAYALAWFLLNDRVKLLAYRILDRGTTGATPEARSRTKPDAENETKPEAKARTPSDLTPQIAKRAYELYDERRRGVQDWEKAEREVRKDASPQ